MSAVQSVFGTAKPTWERPVTNVRFGCASTPAFQVPEGFQFDTYIQTKTFSPSGKLSLGQKLCTGLIRGYQLLTRATLYKWMGQRDRESSSCQYYKAGSLTCSEYTLASIQFYGVLKGIWRGGRSVFTCDQRLMPMLQKVGLTRPSEAPLFQALNLQK